MSPKWVGIFFGAPAVGYFVGNWYTGRNAKRLGVNKLILWGAIAVTAGTVLMLILFLVGLGSAVTFFGLMTFVGLGNGMVIPNATAGMLSVRPHLAGTYPLIVIMMFTSISAVLAILSVYRREARLAKD